MRRFIFRKDERIRSMKKTILKIVVLAAVFVLTLVITSKIMNTGHENLTMEMAEASFPTVSMVREGVVYNTLYGYRREGNAACEKGTVTVLGASRQTDFVVDTYGRSIREISMKVRGMEDGRLIEDSPVTDYEQEGDRLVGTITLKDLLTPESRYSLELVITAEDEGEFYYYTEVLWSEQTYIDDKLAFVLDFHERLFDREQAKTLTKYLETDPTLEDNSTFAHVGIHASFRQITYGNLAPRQVGATYVTLADTSDTLASIVLDFLISTGTQTDRNLYRVREFYRIRYAEERIYLLDYERTMEQILVPESMCNNDKIALGITDENVEMMESEDGNIVAFQSGGELFCYNAALGRLARVFTFYDAEHVDPRTLFSSRKIRILDVNEAGNVKFAVYGYMPRGRHEGEVGIEIFDYDGAQNTIEELVYLPYDKTAAILEAEMDRLLYLNRENHLYITMEDKAYAIRLEDRSYEEQSLLVSGDKQSTSRDHRLLVDLEGDMQMPSKLTIINLKTESQVSIEAARGEAIYFLGFVGEDLIYGRARTTDVCQESSGAYFYPMYMIGICDEDGTLIKEYAPEGIHVKRVSVEENQITMERISIGESGTYQVELPDHITTGKDEGTAKNTVAVANIDIYEKYVQIQTRDTIATDSLLVMTPKEVVYEGGRELRIEAEEAAPRYYVYEATGIGGIYDSPSNAILLAGARSCQVYDQDGTLIWKKTTRAIRNQIMAIGEETVTEDKDSLAICLDTILKFNDVIRNSDYLMGQGQTVLGILEENLPDAKVLDLTGCSMESMLYYINRDIPVLALKRDGNAVLLTGFNETQVVILDPLAGTLSKVSQTEAATMFEENGNSFITYIR